MRVVIGLIVASALAGCATTGSGISRSTGDYNDLLVLSPQAQLVLAGGQTSLPAGAPNDAVLLFLAQSRPQAERAQAVARATATALIMNSDALCERYMAGFMLKSRTTTSTLRVTGLALTSAAGVTTPVRSANLLSGIAAFTNGAEDKLSKTVIADKAPELIYKAVMAERTKERSRLLALLENSQLGVNAPSVVLAQLSDYHGRCGPTIGINGLTDSVQGAAETAGQKGAEKAETFVKTLK